MNHSSPPRRSPAATMKADYAINNGSLQTPTPSLLSKPNINDDPKLIAEILCRLPSKNVFRCKCVSKRWLALISNLSFVRRFACQQGHTNRDAILFYSKFPFDYEKNKEKTDTRWELFTMSRPPASGFQTCNMSLSFLPCYDATKKKEPYVVATYDDLVLCCPTRGREREYYICNPCTKQWLALPPPPRIYPASVLAGFICDGSYYDHKKLTSRICNINAEYRYRVVRISQYEKGPSEYFMDVFCSEIGEWRESVVSCSQHIGMFFCCPGTVYNGMLYYLGSKGLVIRINPFNNTNSGDIIGIEELCPPVEFCKAEYNIMQCLGVCQGRLRMCYYNGTAEDEDGSDIFYVWELKEEADEIAGRAAKWCLMKKFALSQLVENSPDIARWRKTYMWISAKVRAFDPNDGDILYIEFDGDIFACNFRTRSAVKRARARPNGNDFGPWANAYSLSLPCWPTPIEPKCRNHQN